MFIKIWSLERDGLIDIIVHINAYILLQSFN